MMGLSLGISPEELYLHKHLTDVEKIFEKVGQPA